MRTRPTLALAAGLLALTGCSFSASIGEKAIPVSDLERDIPDQITGTLAGDDVEVDCSGGLDAEVDATTDCVVSGQGLEYDIELVATEVDGDNVAYDINATSDIRGETDGDFLAASVSENLAESVGRPPELVECPDGLVPEVGQTIRCSLTDGGQTYGVTVTVTEVELASFSFDIEVDQQPS